MNQEKIGKFIAECRKKKNLTQMKLAETLNISDKTVSKWETGKGMPDVSIMLELCNELGITVNELLCGEYLDKENSLKKADENIILISRDAEKNRKKKNILTVCLIIIIFSILLGIFVNIIYKNSRIDVKYDSRVLSCEITNSNIECSLIGSSMINLEYEQVNTNEETLIFIKGSMLLQNKINSHFEIWDSMAQLNVGQDVHFSTGIYISKEELKDCKDKIKVYYTNMNLNSIKRLNKEELDRIIQGSDLIAEN